jgi:HPt (histidine-containing phosphotransfer) domain-containing protein
MPARVPSSVVRRLDVLPEAIPGIDLFAGLVRLRQNHVLYRKLLLEFYREHYHTAEHIGFALAEGKTEYAKRMIHAVKGVSGNLGMIDLYSSATELDESLKRGGSNPVLLSAFQNNFNQMINALALLPEQTQIDKVNKQDDYIECDVSCLSQLLSTLAGQLKVGSPRAIDILVDVQACLGGVLQKQMARLETQIDNFDFEAAGSTLIEIQNALKDLPLVKTTDDEKAL